MLSKLTISALLLSGVEGQYRSRRSRVIDGNAAPPRRSLAGHGNASNGSNATTAAPNATTAAPTTVAATTVAATTVAATTVAATTVAATTVAATQAATTVAATQAATTAAATQAATTAAATTTTFNTSNGTVTPMPVAQAKTDVSMVVEIDISAMNGATKTALGNAFAYGLHSSMCETVKSLWTPKLSDCFLGKSGDNVGFEMNLDIDTALTGGTPVSCDSADGKTLDANCYGDVPPTRRLGVASKLTNKAAFTVKAKGPALAKVAEAQASLNVAKTQAASGAGPLSPKSIAAVVKTAAERPAMKTTLSSVIANFTAAVEKATMNITVGKVTGATVAPAAASSGAYTSGIAGAFALTAGALLF